VTPRPRGYAALGVTFWLLCGLGLGLQLVGAVVVLVRPDVRNCLYAVMAESQALQLMLAAADAVPGLASVSLLAGHEATVRMALDVVTCGALLQATLLYPTPAAAPQAFVAAHLERHDRLLRRAAPARGRRGVVVDAGSLARHRTAGDRAARVVLPDHAAPVRERDAAPEHRHRDESSRW
jgi:hypothetical protein